MSAVRNIEMVGAEPMGWRKDTRPRSIQRPFARFMVHSVSIIVMLFVCDGYRMFRDMSGRQPELTGG